MAACDSAPAPEAAECRVGPARRAHREVYCMAAAPVHRTPISQSMTRQQAQLHWNACHGAESRQHIRYSQQRKYIQAHTIDSTFIDELAVKRGYEIDPTIIGHAEGWVELNQAPKKFAEEESAEVMSMTMDDIDLFSDKERGSVFFATEHYVLDDQVITRPAKGDKPMPEFFSAVY